MMTMKSINTILFFLCFHLSFHCIIPTNALAILPTPFKSTRPIKRTNISLSASSSPEEESLTDIPSTLVNTVAVAGATGRTGSLVVQELMSRGYKVIALVRDLEKAKGTLDIDSDLITVLKCDLGSESEIVNCIKDYGCDAAIWCATGFSDAPGSTILRKFTSLFGIAFTPKSTIDAVGVPALARAFLDEEMNLNGDVPTATLPKVVMLSSAGVTRPSWDDEKKELFKGCADIPIVRLNPFGILDIKAESEEQLRKSGVPYAIFRPTGLNDDWPTNSRPVFSQGDVAVGRIHRKDVSKILSDCLTAPEAVGKTFEAFTLAGYTPPPSIRGLLETMSKDEEGLPSPQVLKATYSAMQQLLPGEKQDAASLAMGQTYEQLDKNEAGRLGQRGTEDAESALLESTSS